MLRGLEFRRMISVGGAGGVGARELAFPTLGGGAAPPSRAERAGARQADVLPALGVGRCRRCCGLDALLPLGARDVESVFAVVADVHVLLFLVEVWFSAEIAEAAVPADTGFALFGELGVVLVKDERIVEFGKRWSNCPPLPFDFLLSP